MKKDEVVVGSKYRARVSGSLVTVKIVEDRGSSYDWRSDRSKHLGWNAINLKTNRPVTIRSAQRLRPMPAKLVDAAACKARAKRCACEACESRDNGTATEVLGTCVVCGVATGCYHGRMHGPKGETCSSCSRGVTS